MARQNENPLMTPSGKRVWALAPTYSRWLRQVGGGINLWTVQARSTQLSANVVQTGTRHFSPSCKIVLGGIDEQKELSSPRNLNAHVETNPNKIKHVLTEHSLFRTL